MTSPTPAPRLPRLTPQSLVTASECTRRLWLRHRRHDQAAGPADHVLMLRERADAHERAIAARFPGLVGPIWRRDRSFTEAVEETRQHLARREGALWHPAFASADGRRTSTPVFTWWDDDVFVITDVRLALRPETRPDFALQLAHHRALVRECAGLEPGRFEIVNGYGETVEVAPASERTYAAALAAAERTLASDTEPDELLAHSTCRSCEFYKHCWDRAEAERRVEVLPEVQSGHVAAYHAAGVRTLEQLAGLDAARELAGVPAPLLKRAVIAAGAWRDDRAVWLRALELPAYPVVWLDFEGDARGEDAETPIYLWGLALDDGDAPPRGEAIVAATPPAGDRDAWERFLARAAEIRAAHPDVRWVHWDHYEPLWIRRYAERYPSPAGLVEWLGEQCFDLKRVLDRTVRLPLRSYSIKHVARWMGFAWRNPESGSEWSTARFHQATIAPTAEERAALLREVAEYNEDDLFAMRAIWRWLREHEER